MEVRGKSRTFEHNAIFSTKTAVRGSENWGLVSISSIFPALPNLTPCRTLITSSSGWFIANGVFCGA